MLKNKKTTRTSKKGFRTKDFAVKDFSALAVASYTTVFEDNGSNLTTSIAYGTSSSLLTEQISATFSPTSGISSVDIYAPALSGDTTYFGAISSNQTFPYTLLNDGFGNSQVVTIGVVYNNTRLHSANEIESVRFVASLSGASLYATASGDSINPSLTGSVLNSSSYGALTAAPATIVYDFTPQLSAINTSVVYGVSSSALLGTATFTTSSLAGNNTGISSVNFDVYLSGSDTSKFSSISAIVALPATDFGLGLVSFNTIFNNTYTHSSTEYFTVNVVVSSTNATLSSGWTGPYVPSTTTFSAGTYTLTAVGDAAAPSGITSFRTTPFINGLNIYWTDPTDSDLSAIQIKFSTVSAVSARNEGTLLANVAAGIQSTQHYPLTANTVYYYSAFSQDNVNKWSTIAVSAYGVPIDNDIAGAFSWETTQQTRARYIVEGII